MTGSISVLLLLLQILSLFLPKSDCAQFPCSIGKGVETETVETVEKHETVRNRVTKHGMTRWLFSFLLYKILVNIIHCQLLRFYFCNTFSTAQVLYNHQTARYTIFISVFVSMTMRI